MTDTAKDFDLDVLIGWCANHVMKTGSFAISRDDLKQEGYLAILKAQRAGKLPEDKKHQRGYIFRRALGAMVDAQRTSCKQFPVYLDEIEENFEPAPKEFSAEFPLQLEQAMKALNKKNSQFEYLIKELVEGSTCQEIADKLGVTPFRISALRQQIRKVAQAYF